jgi:competence protein ComEA
MLYLRPGEYAAQNGAVRISAMTKAGAVGILCLSLGSLAQSAPQKPPAPPTEGRVDINHASLAELLKVPGLTRSWAGRIVRFRPYRTKQDLLDRGVVSSQVYDRIKENIIAHRDKE